MSLAEIKKIDAGARFDPRYSGEELPLLEEAIDCIRDYPVHFCIEFKIKEGNDPEEIAVLAHKIFKERKLWGKFVVNSFDRDFLKLMKQKDRRYRIVPDVSIEETGGDVGKLVEESLELQADGVEYRYTELTPRVLYALHRNLIPVWVWTVNECEDIERMVAMGVDGILSNYPDRTREILSKDGLAWAAFLLKSHSISS